jgi:riboflavin kinase
MDVAEYIADLPLEAAAVAVDGKTMDGEGGVAAAKTASTARTEDCCGGSCWTFEVPPLYAMRDKVEMRAPVVSGFGRGSRQMGVPTANMDPAVLSAELSGMRRGVYFGFARLPDDTDDGSAWEKCVINVGQRPTFADGDGVTIEVHVLKDFTRDFYGETMECVALGYLRPEMKFAGLSQLVGRIMTDIGLARNALDAECFTRAVVDGQNV